VENLIRADGVKLLNSEGEEVLFRRQPRLHDGKQMERLRRTIVEMEKNKVRINWPNIRMLGFGDRVIKDYFDSVKKLPAEQCLDQRRQKKRKIDQVVMSDNDNEVKY